MFSYFILYFGFCKLSAVLAPSETSDCMRLASIDCNLLHLMRLTSHIHWVRTFSFQQIEEDNIIVTATNETGFPPKNYIKWLLN